MDIGKFFLQAIPVVVVLGLLAVLLTRASRNAPGSTRPDDPALIAEARTLVVAGRPKEAAKLIRRRTGAGTIDANGIVAGLEQQAGQDG